jgi:hypothetical protein
MIVVPPGKGAEFELSYCPSGMTMPEGVEEADAESGRPAYHEGSLFFALPTGRALRWTLLGKALEPIAAGSLTHETPAKTSYVIPLRVDNWLKGAQRFSVNIEMHAPEPSTFLRGADTLDVPGLVSRDYKLTFYAYKEGTTGASVRFTNVLTGEFLFYDLSVTATAPGVVDTLRLEAPVRQTTRRVIRVENPLPAETPITFAPPVCDLPTVQVRQLGEMTGAIEGCFEVMYRPLVSTEVEKPTETRLTLSTPELGLYHYDLLLSATPVGSERNLSFVAPLGASYTQVFRFKSFCSADTTFECRTGSPEFFEVVKSVSAPAATSWEGVDVAVEVRFEPCALGDVRDTLTVTSPTGGTYVCALRGDCTRPAPQGPIVVNQGGTASVEFKNVFSDPREFAFTTDNKCFSVQSASARVDARKAVNIVVKYDAGAAGGAGPSGKLFIGCPALPDLPPWIVYLKGVSKE